MPEAIFAGSVPGLPDASWAVAPILGRPDPSFLTEKEHRLYAGFEAERRRREWLAGRRAAHAALEALGIKGASVLRNEAGAPVVEDTEGVEIALTHGHGHAAAIACATADTVWPCVGIDWVDARDVDRIRRIAPRVLTDEERALCRDRGLGLQLAWGAREAIAKATRTGMFMYALSGVKLVGFDDHGQAEVNVEGAVVRYLPAPDGGLVVVAGITRAARVMAQGVAHGRPVGENPVDQAE